MATLIVRSLFAEEGSMQDQQPTAVPGVILAGGRLSCCPALALARETEGALQVGQAKTSPVAPTLTEAD
jgi:hypothetical protein